jgi:hypothetical protein
MSTRLRLRATMLVLTASLVLPGCLEAPPAPTAGFALDATSEGMPAAMADGAADQGEAAVFEASDLFGDEPTYVLAAAPATGASGAALGAYTRLRVMVTLDAVSFNKTPQRAALTDVARVVVGVKSADYTLTQTVASTSFTSGGRYVEVGVPVPAGDLVVAAQAIAKDGQTLATSTSTLPTKNRKAYVTMPLALKFPPQPSPRPTPLTTPKPGPCAQ